MLPIVIPAQGLRLKSAICCGAGFIAPAMSVFELLQAGSRAGGSCS